VTLFFLSDTFKILSIKQTLTDVTGALRFFATAHEFKLPGADVGVRRMLRALSCLLSVAHLPPHAGLIWDTRDSGAVKASSLLVHASPFLILH